MQWPHRLILILVHIASLGSDIVHQVPICQQKRVAILLVRPRNIRHPCASCTHNSKYICRSLPSPPEPCPYPALALIDMQVGALLASNLLTLLNEDAEISGRILQLIFDVSRTQAWILKDGFKPQLLL